MRLHRINELMARRTNTTGQTMAEVRREVAALLGVSLQQLSNIQHIQIDERGLAASQMIALADYFGCSLDDLINPVAREILIHKVVVA